MNAFPEGWRDFFVKEINEPVEHSLRVVLAEAEVSKDAVQINEVGLAAYPLDHTNNPNLLEVVWDKCVSYSILNESFTSVGPQKSADGYCISMLEEISNSDYIRYLRTVSFASESYPGPVTHYRLCSLTHIIDVISLCPPVFRRVEPSEVVPMRVTSRQFQARPSSR